MRNRFSLSLRNVLARARGRALDLLYPGFCRECWTPLPGPEPFCPSCASLIRWITSACPRCGEPAIHPGPSECGGCAGRAIFFDHAAGPCEYTGPWRNAVLRFKYLGDHGVRSMICSAMEWAYHQRFSPARPEAIAPVPPHPWRKLVRGRDPVEELAVSLGSRTGLPVLPLLRRSRWTSSQTSLTRAARIGNPREAYRVRRKYRRRRGSPAPNLPRTVLLVDDVITTGATASECARALREEGARRILVLAAARSPA